MFNKLLISVLIIAYMLQSIVVFADNYETSNIEQTQDIEAKIVNALENLENEIDISEYNIPRDDINSIITKIINKNGQLFYINREYSVKYESLTNDIISITFSFKYNDNDLKININDFNSRIKLIVDEIEYKETELDKIHSCHDYIIKNFNYDESMGSSDAYNMLLTGKGTCMAYTALFGYVLKECGINSTVVRSDKLNHIWNAVEVNGEYYNVDVTWDDPIGGSQFSTSHKYLMKSDEYFNTNKHEGRSSDIDCTSTIYDKYNWGDENILSSIEDNDNIINLFIKYFPIAVIVFIVITVLIIISIIINNIRNSKRKDNNYPPYYWQ